MDRVMQSLAENGEIDRALRDGRIFDVAKTVFEIRESVPLGELRAELDHLGRVIDGDYFARCLGEELRELSFACPEIGDGHRREQRDQRVRERLPGTPGNITA